MFRNRLWVASVVAAVIGGGASLPAWGAEARVRHAPIEDRAGSQDVMLIADDQPAPARGGAPRGGGNLPAVVDDATAEPDARRRRANEDDWFRGPSYREGDSRGSANGEFPSAEVHDFAIANARAATARMMFTRAESALSSAVRNAKRSFEASAELKQALAAEEQAHAAYDRARRDALAAVVSDPKYQAIVALHQDLGEQIVLRRRELTSFGSVDSHPVIADPTDPLAAELFSMAALRMQVAGDARVMEREAIEASDDLRAARERLTAAARKVSELRDHFDIALREDADLVAARRVLEDARVSRVTAAAYLRGSRMAAEEAVDFAYFLHRYDNQVSYDPYFSYGYGSRYGYRNGRY